MRKVLMISHGYPPVGGSGMLRSLKFSRYLPDHDWSPVVITLRRTNHPRLDPRLLSEVPPEATVYRSPMWNPLDLLIWLRRLAGKLLRRGGDGGADCAESAPSQAGSGADPTGDSFIARVKDYLTFPDGYIGWVPPGFIIGFWAILRHRPRVIYSTSPPPSAHLLGGSLARISGLPWVVDFRDPWTLQFPNEALKTRRGQRSRRLEAKVLSRAACIICNTEPLARELRSTYPQIDPKRFVVITNGYDPADFATDPGQAPAEGPFRFVHTGEFFPVDDMRVPDPFLTALRDLIDEGRVDADDVRVRLIGSGEYSEMDQFHALLESPTLRKVVELVDFMPHGDIPAELADSHALLLFQNADVFRLQVPAKTFEYIRAARPILAVAAPGATADLVASVAGGHTVLPGDDAGIRTVILELLSGRGEPFHRSDDELGRFTRPGLTRNLAEVLDRVSRSRAAVQPTTSRT